MMSGKVGKSRGQDMAVVPYPWIARVHQKGSMNKAKPGSRFKGYGKAYVAYIPKAAPLGVSLEGMAGEEDVDP